MADDVWRGEEMGLFKQELEDVVLRLPASLRDRAEEMASRQCVSLNLFLLTAVAEKLQRLQQSLELGEKDDLKRDGTNDSPFLVH